MTVHSDPQDRLGMILTGTLPDLRRLLDLTFWPVILGIAIIDGERCASRLVRRSFHSRELVLWFSSGPPFCALASSAPPYLASAITEAPFAAQARLPNGLPFAWQVNASSE